MKEFERFGSNSIRNGQIQANFEEIQEKFERMRKNLRESKRIRGNLGESGRIGKYTRKLKKDPSESEGMREISQELKRVQENRKRFKIRENTKNAKKSERIYENPSESERILK